MSLSVSCARHPRSSLVVGTNRWLTTVTNVAHSEVLSRLHSSPLVRFTTVTQTAPRCQLSTAGRHVAAHDGARQLPPAALLKERRQAAHGRIAVGTHAILLDTACAAGRGAARHAAAASVTAYPTAVGAAGGSGDRLDAADTPSWQDVRRTCFVAAVDLVIGSTDDYIQTVKATALPARTARPPRGRHGARDRTREPRAGRPGDLAPKHI